MSENNDLNTLSGDEIELLFPWYIAGTLDEPDRRRVEAYLEAHPEAAAQLELIREEQEETILSNESLGSPSAAALGRLMHEINADSAKPSLATQAKSGIMGVLDNFIAGLSPGALRWTGAGALVLLIAQAVIIGGLLGPGDQSPNNYQTATGTEQTAAEGTFLLIKFAPGATAEQIGQLMSDEDARIVDGPKPGGFYKVKIASRELSEADIDATLKKITNLRNIVEQVLVAD